MARCCQAKKFKAFRRVSAKFVEAKTEFLGRTMLFIDLRHILDGTYTGVIARGKRLPLIASPFRCEFC